MKRLLPIILVAIILASCSSHKNSSTNYNPKDKLLYDTIVQQDSLLFSAFNKGDLNRVVSFLSTDLEVFQDNIGIRNYSQTQESFKSLFEKDYVLTRTLIKNSVEVYPIKDFGAIQTGKHTFCHVENGKEVCATYKFVEIWKKENEKWKIVKIITYDH